MNRSKKKSFDWYGARQRFSIRKYHIGAASVLLGTTLVLGTGTIVGAETGVNGGTSNGQIVPGNGTGTSDGTQPQGDNQGDNSSGVQTGNTTNSTANVQPAGDTGSASSQPVGTSRSANTGTQGDGTTNPTVDEPIIKFPTQDNQTPPAGYQKVEFYPVPGLANLNFEGNPGEITSGNSKKVVFWVKTGTTWGALMSDPQFRIPKYTVADGDFILSYASNVGQVAYPIDFDALKDTPIVDRWQINTIVDYIIGDVTDGKTFEEYMNSGAYKPFQIPQFHGITLDANGGTIGGKAKKAFYVAYQHVQWGDQLVTKKIDDASNKASRDGYTFVRWQTATGGGIPTSGQIDTIEFTAVWLEHPTDKVAVFDRTKLTDSEKEQVKQKIYDANPDLSTGVAPAIKAIDISATGEATVTFDDGTAVKVPSATLTNEDKATARSNAKAEIEKDAMEKSAAINASNLTEEEKRARLTEVRDVQDRADIAIDNAATTEDLTKAISDGTAAIEAVSTTSTIKTKAKEALEEAYNAEKAEIENSVLTADEKVAKQAELTKAKENAIKAVDDAKTDSAVEGALNNGKATIESTYTAIIKIPSSASETAPEGYVTVTFNKSPWDKGLTLGNQSGNSVRIFVKNDVTWATLLSDPAWQWPTVNTNSGDIVVGWGSHTNYSASVAFVYDKMKDQVVRNTQLWPNVVYEVEDVHSTIDAYLKQYGADEQDKWLFVTFDAGQGATLKGTTNQSKSVAVYYQNIGYDNSLFTKKVVNGVLANHTFVRWQTADGKVLPTSGTITSTEVYNALYLAHPTDKTTVFDANKLTETEKDSLKQAISNANPTSANLIQSITVSDTGEATVTYNEGTIVTVPASDLINEDKEPARNLAKEEIDDKLAEEKAAIEAKRDAAIAEINNTPGLTDDQKQAATDAVTNTANDALTALDTAADDAKKAIDTKTTAADFNDAKTAGEKALDDAKAAGEAAINLTKDKELAKADVENQAAAAIEAIKNNPNLDATEQAPYIDAIEKAAEEQKAAIDAAKDTVGITDAVNAAETVNEEQKLAAAKEDAKDKIAEEAVAAKDAIDKNPNLSDAEKTTAKNAVDTEVAKANDAIDKATTPETVQAAEDNGVKAIDAVELAAAKQDAKNKIAEDVKAANAAIESNPNLTKDEIDAAKDEVAKEAEKANQAIDAATTPEAVQAKEEEGTKAIAADVLDAAKQDAKNKIAEDVEAANTAIESNPNLTKDEIDAAKAAVAKAAEDANKAIDAAKTPEAAQTAEDNGVKAIDAKELDAAKQDAKNKIAEEAAAAKDAIDKDPNLSDAEKTAAKNAVDTEVAKANDAIDKAKTPAEAQTAEDNGVKAIDAEELAAAKQDAKNKIAEDVKAAKDAIDKDPNLSEDEKKGFKDAVDTEAAKAVADIEKATTPADAQTAEEAGTAAIAEDVLDAAKQDAKNKIAEDVKAAKEAIDNNPNLSETEKQGFKDAVDTEAVKANGEIDKATTPEAAQAAEEAGTAAIAEDVLDAAKQDAKNKIAKDLATVEAAIDANSNLSEDEKKAAKLEAQAKAAEAVANIEKATTPEAVQTLEDAAVKDLANIEIKAAYDDAVKAIEAADNLSTAAKTKALDDLKKARQAAEEAIKTATTADEVAKGALDGLKSLAKIEATAAADDAKEAIAKNSNLTADEKKVYTDAIDKALKDTETKIDAATDADTVDAETVLAQKDIAKQEVAAATADAVKGIEANTNLTDAEKDEYKATVTKAAETAEKAIADATTAADIQSKTFDATQDVAKAEVKADAADAIAGIKANDNLSDTAKEEAIAAIEEARDTTLENIENAKTAADVDAATLDAEKANAKAEIKAAADDAKKAIDENANLPASDKNALKLAIDAEVAATNLEIDNAKTAEEIDAATLATEKSIAKAEVKAAAEDALQAIDENANLTDDEKAKAKADVYVELSKAEKAIDKATTADAIDNATLVGEKA
ncbi:TPA: DUF1542 domain-containing protein, partial [Streptococcus suis]|nr:DUF1542 domain-containing protein [Streptococcus suis]